MSKTRTFKDVDVVRQGTQIILPEGMSYADGIKWLDAKAAEENRMVVVQERLEGYPFDCAHALALAVTEVYGFSSKIPTETFFGPEPPRFISIPVDHTNKTTEIFVGKFKIPGIEGDFQTGGGEGFLQVYANIKQKYRPDVEKLLRVTREKLRTCSLYRGKAITISYQPNPKFGNLEMQPPTFLAPHTGNAARLNLDLMRAVEAAVWTPIKYTEQVRKAGVSLRRGILFAGEYGTGKTLIARMTADLCVANNWTFIYCNTPEAIMQAFDFGRTMKSRVVIFAEDFDEIIKKNDKNALQNLIDGIDTKGLDIILVFTTNFVDDITPALARPGRIDAVLHFVKPDAATAELLVRDFAGDRLAEGEDLSEVGRVLANQLPAVIRCVVDGATLHALNLSSGVSATITAEAMLLSAKNLREHVAMVTKQIDKKKSEFEQMGEMIGQQIVKGAYRHKLGMGLEFDEEEMREMQGVLRD